MNFYKSIVGLDFLLILYILANFQDNLKINNYIGHFPLKKKPHHQSIYNSVHLSSLLFILN